MALDADRAKATRLDPRAVTVERGRLAFFARATGQTDPVYLDLDAAKAAGHPDLPVPPTFFFSLELAQPDSFDWLIDLGVDELTVLHGEQSFSYHGMAYAGDTLTLQPRVLDVLDKKGGAMQLLLKQTEITRDGEPIAAARTAIVIPNPTAQRTSRDTVSR